MNTKKTNRGGSFCNAGNTNTKHETKTKRYNVTLDSHTDKVCRMAGKDGNRSDGIQIIARWYCEYFDFDL